MAKPEGTVVSDTYCGALNVLEPVVAYFDSMVVTRLLNEPEALESDPEVKYDDALTLSIELDSAEPVTSRAVTLVLNDPLVVDREDDNVLNELVNVNTVLSKPSNVSALDAYDAEVALAAADPDITPVVITAPEALMYSNVVEPLTKLMLPFASVLITLVRKPVFLLLLIVVCCLFYPKTFAAMKA